MPYGKQLTQAGFEARFVKKFGEGYDLSGSKYLHARSKIEVLCFEHGAFKTTPDLLFSSRTKIACPACRKIHRDTSRAEQAQANSWKKRKRLTRASTPMKMLFTSTLGQRSR